ncbi:unnamed protein product [Didymodactylos carnosus]|uniref:Uncharacterized protein n=1 Tax=Didymodactylos carnosus TaxID=1234261 RepID=A0A8S2EU01_9BILA|nr:unnamed protein product [Didymodactylos carnosus]CAF4045591.1 unnamed protein product [Didymodactylos carnosus]
METCLTSHFVQNCTGCRLKNSEQHDSQRQMPVINHQEPKQMPIVNHQEPKQMPIVNYQESRQMPVVNHQDPTQMPIVNYQEPRHMPIVNYQDPTQMPIINHQDPRQMLDLEKHDEELRKKFTRMWPAAIILGWTMRQYDEQGSTRWKVIVPEGDYRSSWAGKAHYFTYDGKQIEVPDHFFRDEQILARSQQY